MDSKEILRLEKEITEVRRSLNRLEGALSAYPPLKNTILSLFELEKLDREER